MWSRNKGFLKSIKILSQEEQNMAYTPLVLYSIKDQKKAQQITALCKKLGIRAKEVQVRDADEKVGVLAGIEPLAAGAKKAAPLVVLDLPEYLIFSGLPEVLLDQFLKEYRQQGIDPSPLKAVVTLHNKDWTVRNLIMELMKERMSMMNLGGNKPENK